LHTPDHLSRGGERNYHAHVLVTTRRIEGDKLSARKATDLEPQMRYIGGKRIVVEAEQWGEVWARHQPQNLSKSMLRTCSKLVGFRQFLRTILSEGKAW
jgi:hypothetical protein